MYPHERSLVEQLSGKPFAILGVNSDGNRTILKAVLKQQQITWRSWWNGGGTDGAIASRWNVRAWPTLYLLDGEGVIRFKNARNESLNRAIEKLLAEMGHEVSLDEKQPL